LWYWSWDYSPFVLLLIVEFVDVMPARLCKSDVEILPGTIAPVHGVSEEIDEVGKAVVRRVDGYCPLTAISTQIVLLSHDFLLRFV
jgi:hypothetical protein